jgi:hypothetical protein
MDAGSLMYAGGGDKVPNVFRPLQHEPSPGISAKKPFRSEEWGPTASAPGRLQEFAKGKDVGFSALSEPLPVLNRSPLPSTDTTAEKVEETAPPPFEGFAPGTPETGMTVPDTGRSEVECTAREAFDRFVPETPGTGRTCADTGRSDVTVALGQSPATERKKSKKTRMGFSVRWSGSSGWTTGKSLAQITPFSDNAPSMEKDLMANNFTSSVVPDEASDETVDCGAASLVSTTTPEAIKQSQPRVDLSGVGKNRLFLRRQQK